MYYTSNGRYAIVVAEAHKRLNFLDAATMKLTALKVPCNGGTISICPPMVGT